MSDIWSTNNKYQLWLKIELYACEIQEKIRKYQKINLVQLKIS